MKKKAFLGTFVLFVTLFVILSLPFSNNGFHLPNPENTHQFSISMDCYVFMRGTPVNPKPPL